MITVEQLKSINDISAYANRLISATYNTSAVTVLDIMKRATPEQLKLDVYEREVYSIIIQMEEKWVADAIRDTHNKWKEEHKYATHYIHSYLEDIGVPESEYGKNKAALISALPTVYQRESSPDIYKQYLAVMLLRNSGEKGNEDLADKIFAETSRIIEYSAVAECELEMGTPAHLASAKATERVINECKKNDADSLAGMAGKLVGKVVNFKYDTASDFEEMFRESLGEYGDEWDAHREEVRARKEAIKQYKEELKYKQKIADLERKHQNEMQRDRMREERRGMGYTMPNQPYQYNSYGRYRGTGNLHPKVPVFLIGILVNLLVAVIAFLVTSKVRAIICTVALVLASAGFIVFRTNRQNGILTILAGYAITVTAMLL